MDSQILQTFLDVEERGNFSKAAKIEGRLRTQSAVSHQIARLEEELGLDIKNGERLFDRRKGQEPTLTRQGEILKKLAEPLMKELLTLKERFEEEMNQGVRVRIATHTSVMTHVLPDVIKRFKKKHQDCRISIVNRSRGDILSMLRAGDVDIGITSFADMQAQLSDDIKCEKFKEFERLLIGPKGHPLSKKKKISLEDIAKYPLLLPPEGSSMRQAVDRIFKDRGLTYSLAMEATGKLVTKVYVELKLGVSIVNEFYVSENDPKIFALNVSRIFGRTERAILTRKNRPQSETVKEFIRLLKTV